MWGWCAVRVGGKASIDERLLVACACVCEEIKRIHVDESYCVASSSVPRYVCVSENEIQPAHQSATMRQLSTHRPTEKES